MRWVSQGRRVRRCETKHAQMRMYESLGTTSGTVIFTAPDVMLNPVASGAAESKAIVRNEKERAVVARTEIDILVVGPWQQIAKIQLAIDVGDILRRG